MTEKEENVMDIQRISLQVDRQEYDGDSIDLVNVAANMGKRKKLFIYLAIMAACAGCLLGAALSAVEIITGKGACAKAVVSFNFDGIDQGLDPNGGAFDVAKLKSTVVINDALEELEWQDISPEAVRSCMKIEGVIPDEVKQRIAVINVVAEDAAEYYANIEDLDYFPSRYIVTLQKGNGLSGSRTRELLDAVLSSYRDYFMDTYANTEALAASYNVLNFETYDYLQAADMLANEMDVMKNYVDARNEEDAAFRANSTGFSFGDLSASINTLINLDLANFSSFVQSHNLTKDAGTRADYYDYQIKQFSLQIAELNTQLSNVENTIQNYEKDPVIVMSTQESVTETDQKNAYYDELLGQKLEITGQIAQLNTDLNRTYELLESLADTANAGSEDEYAYADTLLTNLMETVRVWSGLVQATADEYYNTTRFADAYRITVPAQYSAVGSLGNVIKKMAACGGAMAALVIFLWCGYGVKEELVRGRKDNHA